VILQLLVLPVYDELTVRLACILQAAGMETDDLQVQLSQLQQLIADEEQKRQRQKVQILLLFSTGFSLSKQ